MKNILIKRTNDRILELNCAGVEYYKSVSGKQFDLIFENGTETTKEELLKNAEIKKHKELRGHYVKNYGNKLSYSTKVDWKTTLELWQKDSQAYKERKVIKFNTEFTYKIKHNNVK